MSISSEFTCKCGRYKGWITDNETQKVPCPKCGRIYKGIYNKDSLTIEALEITQTLNEECWIIYGKRYCKWIYGKLVYESTGGPGSVDFDWDKVIRNRNKIIGFNHTHPSNVIDPSSLDDMTMTGWVKALGKPLLCGIKSRVQKFYLYKRGKDQIVGCFEVPFMILNNRILAKIG